MTNTSVTRRGAARCYLGSRVSTTTLSLSGSCSLCAGQRGPSLKQRTGQTSCTRLGSRPYAARAARTYSSTTHVLFVRKMTRYQVQVVEQMLKILFTLV